MIFIEFGNVWAYIKSEIPYDVKKHLQAKLSYILPNFRFTAKYKAMEKLAEEKQTPIEWDGTLTIAKDSQYGLKFPVGLISYCKEVLDEYELEYKFIDKRLPASKSSGYSLHNLTLRDYQISATDAGLNRTRGIGKIGTGGGKTKCSIRMIVDAATFPAIFYVPNCDLLEQTYDEFSKHIYYNGEPAKIGRIGAGYCDVQPITVATIQSCELALTGKKSEKNEFDDVDFEDKTDLSEQQRRLVCEFIKDSQTSITDESQHVSCSTIQTILNSSFKARNRWGMSASPWRDDGLDILIEAAFGRRFCDIPSSFLIDRGFLVQPNITFNHFSQYFGTSKNFNTHYTQFVVENEVRNKWIAEKAKMHMGLGRPTIVLVKWAKHAEIIADLIKDNCEVLTSTGVFKKNPKKRKEILNRMRERKLQCIIGTTLLDEGVDLPNCSAGIFAGGGKSSTRALQRVGRFIRPDPSDSTKTCAFIEEFLDHTRYLQHHSFRRKQIYETEPRFNIFHNKETLEL